MPNETIRTRRAAPQLSKRSVLRLQLAASVYYSQQAVGHTRAQAVPLALGIAEDLIVAAEQLEEKESGSVDVVDHGEEENA